MADTNLVCEECREAIASVDVSTCPHCGHNPGGSVRKSGRRQIGIGGLLTMTVVGAVIGVPLILNGWWKRRTARGATPAVPA